MLQPAGDVVAACQSQLGEAVTVAQDRPVIATISDRRRNAAVRAMHAERLRAARRYLGAFMKASISSGYGHLPRLPRLSWLARLGCYAEVMTVTLHLDDAVAEALAAEAARRGQTA
ncbi:MAG: hypothetical protein ACRDOE_26920, partial [Streptosporangiaceae bacterium]